MTKKRKNINIFIIVCCVCMLTICSIFVGRTYAYFSAMEMAQGSITLGTLQLNSLTKKDGTAISWNIANIVPNQEVGGSYKANIATDIKYYIRILFKAEITPVDGKIHKNGTNCRDNVPYNEILKITVNEDTYKKSDSEDKDGYLAYYKLSPSVANTTTEEFDLTLRMYDWVGEGKCDFFMNATINISMKVQIIQADYLEDEGLGETFATANEMHTLWETVW